MICHTHQTCVNDALATAESLCQERGVRFTALRKKVLTMVWESHQPAKAYDILDRLKSKTSPAKPPTVYRALDFLLENGFIHKLNRLNAYVGCSHPTQHHECYFFICETCGTVEECCNDNIVHAIADTAKKSRFNPHSVTVEIEGQCQQCQ